MGREEDYHTTTVDGAAGFEKYHHEPEDDGTPTLAELEAEERQIDDEDYDDCGCSDPGCPCSGSKSGRL